MERERYWQYWFPLSHGSQMFSSICQDFQYLPRLLEFLCECIMLGWVVCLYFSCISKRVSWLPETSRKSSRTLRILEGGPGMNKIHQIWPMVCFLQPDDFSYDATLLLKSLAWPIQSWEDVVEHVLGIKNLPNASQQWLFWVSMPPPWSCLFSLASFGRHAASPPSHMCLLPPLMLQLVLLRRAPHPSSSCHPQ